jgi:hypothetical protein
MTDVMPGTWHLAPVPAPGRGQAGVMSRSTLSFIALAISMFYGVGFVVIPEDSRTGYAVIGAVVVALAWIASGRFGRPDAPRDDSVR